MHMMPIPLPVPPVAPRRRTQLESLLVLRRNVLELWGELAYTEKIILGRFLGRDQIMVNDPDAIRHVLIDNWENYERSQVTKRVLQPLLGRGLFLAEGEAWRQQRRTIAPALAPRAMPILSRHIVAASAAGEDGLEKFVGGHPIELLPELQQLALAIAAQSMFSLESAEFGPQLREMLLRYAIPYARPSPFDLLLPPGWRSPADVGRAKFRREWLAFMDGIIAARQKNPPAPDSPRDLFDLLAAARDMSATDRRAAAAERALLRDEVSTMIIAGHETTATTLFWCCTIAALRPEHQRRIAEEAARLDLSAEGAAGAIKSLVFTRAFVDEALRLYPPAFLIVRQAIGPDEIAGRPIKPGTAVSISPWVLHRHRRLWNDPEEFDPGRFMEGAEPPPRFAYMPFGAGPRVCVGAQFALTEAVLVLARLLRRFRLELDGPATMIPRGLVTTQPDRPVRFWLRRA
jgi:unspecific monooxygenase